MAFLDADDWWDTGYLASQLQYIGQAKDIGLVHAATRTYDGRSGELLEQWNLPPLPAPSDQFEMVRTEDYRIGCPSAVVVKRAVLDKVGRFDENLRLGEDWDMWARVAQVTHIAQNNAPTVNITALPTFSRTRTRSDQFILWLRVFDRWSEDEAFCRKIEHRARYHLLGHQISLLRSPHELLFEFPRKLRSNGGIIALLMFPTYRSYLASLLALPLRATHRAIEKAMRKVRPLAM